MGMKSSLLLLDQAEARFVRILWCDNGNVIRGKAVHRNRLNTYSRHGVGISAAQQAIPVMYDAPVAGAGLGPVGEIRLVPGLEHAHDFTLCTGSRESDGRYG